MTLTIVRRLVPPLGVDLTRQQLLDNCSVNISLRNLVEMYKSGMKYKQSVKCRVNVISYYIYIS